MADIFCMQFLGFASNFTTGSDNYINWNNDAPVYSRIMINTLLGLDKFMC